ncbi:hypothetical protein CDAR_564451 [Caerostris darwini]|uniref:Uncharacterized protein n=1 Tax=Caerostris darwini TaxID=1538125 RepID=A0AAV4TKG8_9ARAC|nr:hypothetical protein CDAR_564451 [Caerostris darwini]
MAKKGTVILQKSFRDLPLLKDIKKILRQSLRRVTSQAAGNKLGVCIVDLIVFHIHPHTVAVAILGFLTEHDCLSTHLFHIDFTATHLDGCSALNDLDCWH